jgi:hypothetical protein
MDAQATGFRSEFQGQDQSRFIQQKSNEIFALPLVKTDNGLSVPAEVMVNVWLQICNEGKQDSLFYDGAVKNLKDWIDYIYNPSNHVVLIIDELGHVYHIAWINKYYQGSGFVHHCSLGNYNRRTWPTLKKYWQNMKNNGESLVKTVMGVTPVTNHKAIKLLKIIGWNMIGCIPNICFLANENRHIAGMISYCVINEV